MILFKHSRSGKFYKFITMAKHTETDESLVIFEKVEDYTTIFTKEEVQELLDIVSNKIKCVDSVKCRNADIFQKWFSA